MIFSRYIIFPAMEFFLKELVLKIGSVLFLPLTLLLGSKQSIVFYQSPSPQSSAKEVSFSIPSLAPTITPLPTPSFSASPRLSYTAKPTMIPTPKPSLKPIPLPTPTPSPSLSPSPVTGQQLDNWFTAYSNHYSIDPTKLRMIAICESNLNSAVQNGDYAGLYQFSSGTWRSTRAAMNMDPDPQLRFNPEEAIKTAAFKISTVGLSAWPNCVK